MTVDLDPTDWAMLGELQRDGRITLSELGRRISLSASATSERVRRLEAEGVITGYRAEVDLPRAGIALLAVVRLQHSGPRHERLLALVAKRPQVLECLRTTGEDCYLLKVAVGSMAELQDRVDELAQFGSTSTSLVYSTPLPYRGPIGPPPA